jgi:hypothetical protein
MGRLHTGLRLRCCQAGGRIYRIRRSSDDGTGVVATPDDMRTPVEPGTSRPLALRADEALRRPMARRQAASIA